MPQRHPHAAVIAGIIAAWIACSNLFNVSSKVLSVNIAPLAITTAQLLGATIFGLVYVRLTKDRALSTYVASGALKAVVPIGITLNLANFSMMYALSRTSVAVFQTVKASGPLFTATACYFVLRRRYTNATYATLVPIMLGLFAATSTDATYDALGLAASVASAIAQVFVNLSAKEIYENVFTLSTLSSGITRQETLAPIELQMLVSLVGFSCGAGILAIQTASEFLSGSSAPTTSSVLSYEALREDGILASAFNLNLLVNVALYSAENILAYWSNSALSRLPFAVTDASRRLTIVVGSNALFAKVRPTPVNILGVLAVAAGSVLFSFVVEEIRSATTSEKSPPGDEEGGEGE